MNVPCSSAVLRPVSQSYEGHVLYIVVFDTSLYRELIFDESVCTFHLFFLIIMLAIKHRWSDQGIPGKSVNFESQAKIL